MIATSSQDTRSWWCNDYRDGSVWPCALLRNSVMGLWVRPLAPAPDAGQERLVPRASVYDRQLRRP